MSMFWATCKSVLSLFPITFISGLFRSGDQGLVIEAGLEGHLFRANLPSPVLEHVETTQQKHLHTTKLSTLISRLSYHLPPATSYSGSFL